MAKLQKLSSEIRIFLRSGVIMSSVTQCVLELVHNALDAGASSIAIKVNLKTFQIEVVDNGKGMTEEHLKHIGTRYMTSKCHNLDDLENRLHTFGYRGEALASLTEVSQKLTIISKANSSKRAMKKIFYKGEPLKLERFNEFKIERGTVIMVNNFFYNMPVRRKKIKEVFDLEDIREQLECLALIHPEVSFSLRDGLSGKILLQTNNNKDNLKNISTMLGLAVTKLLISVNYEFEKYKISGYVSRETHSDSKIQLIFVNKRLVSSCKIHTLVNILLLKYTGAEVFKTGENTQRTANGSLMHKDGFAVFFLNIDCPYKYYDLCFDPKKTVVNFQNWEEVLRIVKKSIKNSLKNEKIILSGEVSSREIIKNKTKDQETRKQNYINSLLKEFDVLKGKVVKRKRKENNEEVDVKKRKQDEYHFVSETRKDVSFVTNDGKIVTQVHTSMESSVHVTQNNSYLQETPIPKSTENKLCHKTQMISKESIFNIFNIPQLSFHEFQAWLRCKGQYDPSARKLLKEFLEFKSLSEFPRSTRYSLEPDGCKSITLPSIKLIRKKKLAERSKKFRFLALEKENSVPNSENVQIPKSQFAQKVVQTKSTAQQTIDFPQDNENCFKKPLDVGSYIGEDSPNSRKPFVAQRHNLNKFRLDLNQTETSSGQDFSKFFTWRNALSPVGKPSPIEQKHAMEDNRHVLEVNRHVMEDNRHVMEDNRHAMEDNSHVMEDNRHAMEDNRHVRFENVAPTSSPASYYNNISLETSKLELDVSVELPSPTVWARPDEKQNCLVNLSDVDRIIQDIDVDRRRIETPVRCTVETQTGTYLAPPVVMLDKETQATVSTTSVSVQVDMMRHSIPESTDTDQTDSGSVIPTSQLSVHSLVRRGKLLDKCGDMEPSSEPRLVTTADDWRPSLDCDGNIFFKHQSSGFVLFNPPHHSTALPPRFTFTGRPMFLPKGLSPVLPVLADKVPDLGSDERDVMRDVVTECGAAVEDGVRVKWTDNEPDGDKLPSELFTKLCQEAKDKLVYCEDDIASCVVQKPEVKIHRDLRSYTFAKEMLSQVKVIGQLDKRFIIVLMKSNLSSKRDLVTAFDQHAVDERIRYEHLLSIYRDSRQWFHSTPTDPPYTLSCCKSDVNLLAELGDQLNKFGLDIEVVDEETVTVNMVPVCLYNRECRQLTSKGTSDIKVQLECLLSELVEHAKTTRCLLTHIPNVLYKIISTEACHSAVKFGDVLSTKECSDLISKLSACDSPFQCAHGRPCLTPLIDLTDLVVKTKDVKRIDLSKVKKNLRSEADS